VGNTTRHSTPGNAHPVHPHAGGEHAEKVLVERDYLGSPPRRWGTLGGSDSIASSTRFTPTQVGNTNTDGVRGGRMTVHPHAGGEHPDGFCGFIQGGGSPPRRWGTLLLRLAPVPRSRFTPTQVGNTQCSK